MKEQFLSLNPSSLWGYFYDFTQIPRPSFHEDQIIEYLIQFAKEKSLECIKDKAGNIIIRKPGTKGLENAPAVVLQSHVDMVPQKNNDTEHDFENDPLKPYIDEDWVKAKGTTLGADNGIGCSAILAVLASTDIAHPPIEGLFTIEEETGLTGASNLEKNVLKGKLMLNLDSEDEGEVFIGCAGGCDSTVWLSFTEQECPSNEYIAYKISITGLKGGHSGIDISKKRANAIRVMGHLLLNIDEKFGVLLADIEGGTKRNAIPRECFATVALPNWEDENIKALAADLEKLYKEELATEDNDLKITIEECTLPEKFIDTETAHTLFSLVNQLPNGVISWSKSVSDIVETSTNLAIIKVENSIINIDMLQRSSVDEAKEYLCQQIKTLCESFGATVQQSNDYPGWDPKPESTLLSKAKVVHKNLFGKEPEVKVIHAGLECGIIGNRYPEMQMISFGPNIREAHTPNEKVQISSVANFWKYLCEILKSN